MLLPTRLQRLEQSVYWRQFQDYARNGIWLVFGSIQVFGVGFQSTTGYEQILNDGWDIQADAGGVVTHW